MSLEQAARQLLGLLKEAEIALTRLAETAGLRLAEENEVRRQLSVVRELRFILLDRPRELAHEAVSSQGLRLLLDVEAATHALDAAATAEDAGASLEAVRSIIGLLADDLDDADGDGEPLIALSLDRLTA